MNNNFKMKELESSFDWSVVAGEVISKCSISAVDMTLTDIVKQSALHFVDIVFSEHKDDSVSCIAQCDFTGDFESLRTSVIIQDVVVSTNDEDVIDFFKETLVYEMFDSEGELQDGYKIRKDKAKEIVDMLSAAIEKVEALELG